MLEQVYQIIEIERPSFDKDAIQFKLATPVNLTGIFWRIQAYQPEVKVATGDWQQVGNEVTVSFKKPEFNPYTVYKLTGKNELGQPIRFVYRGTESMHLWESHFDAGVANENGLRYIPHLNNTGDVAIQVMARHILDSAILRLPILSMVEALKVTAKGVTINWRVDFDPHRWEMDERDLKPVLIGISPEQEVIVPITYSTSAQSDTTFTVQGTFSEWDSLVQSKYLTDAAESDMEEKLVDYALGLQITHDEQTYLLITNRVSKDVFQNVHPYHKAVFAYQSDILEIDWYDEQGLIFRRFTIEGQSKIDENVNYTFATDYSEVEQKEIDVQYEKFFKEWTHRSALRLL